MAATSLPVSTISRAGFDLTAGSTVGDNVNGMIFSNDGGTYLRVKNGNASSCLVSVSYSAAVDGQTVPARTMTVAATTGDKIMGPFPLALFGSQVSVTLSVATTTVWAFNDAG